jgi:hypothetical protein
MGFADVGRGAKFGGALSPATDAAAAGGGEADNQAEDAELPHDSELARNRTVSRFVRKLAGWFDRDNGNLS